MEDNLGKEIISQTLITAEGINSIKFENLNLPTGAYFITVKMPDKSVTKKVIIVK